MARIRCDPDSLYVELFACPLFVTIDGVADGRAAA